jgi:hypothetical protein
MKKSNRTRLILVGVGILLVLLGVRGLALGLIGQTAQATVVKVEQAVTQQDSPMDHNYQISYRFSVNGKDYTGSFTRKKVFNTATLPSAGSAVPIRYLAAAPSVNGGPDAGPVGGLVLGALGLFLLFLGVKPAKAAPAPVPAEGPSTDSPA